MESLPKISIVTSCYNHKDYIGETIESVLSQGYPNLEYIVIDDGSTDGSWEMIKDYQDRLKHCIRYEGYRDTPVIAINDGLKKTTGEIMCFLNSDDILLPKSLFVIAKVFQEHPEVEWFTGMSTTINSRSEIVNSKLKCKNVYDFLSDNWKVIQQESTFWRRSLWERAGSRIPDEQKWAFDTGLWTKFFQKAEHYHVATPLGAFRASQQSKTTQSRTVFLEQSERHIGKLKKTVSGGMMSWVRIYRLCRFARWFFAHVPHRIFGHIPLLKRFSYRVFRYSPAEDKWQLSIYNPFRIIAP